MRKIYPLLFLITFAVQVLAQTDRQKSAHEATVTILKDVRYPNIVNNTCDSIGWPPPSNYSINYYTLQNNGGFVAGPNRYGDKAKANFWDASGNSGTYLSKLIIGVGLCNGSDLTKAVSLKIYDGTTGVPGSEIGVINSTMQVMRNIAEGAGFGLFQFTPAVILPASKKVFVSIEFPALAWDIGTDPSTKDSLAILTTLFGEPNPSLGWEKWGDDTWIAMNATTAWGAAINLHVYPLVSTNESCSLPVAFGSLKGQYANDAVKLDWSTYAEIDNTGFEIERSADGQKFSSIGFQKTKALNGNSQGQIKYQFTDLAPMNGVNIYRIRQTDKNGLYAHSNIISVFGRNIANQKIRAYYPNPTSGRLIVEFGKNNSGLVTLQITDASGKFISNQKASVTQGNLVLSTTNLKAGVYMLRVVEENGTSSIIKFVKQ